MPNIFAQSWPWVLLTDSLNPMNSRQTTHPVVKRIVIPFIAGQQVLTEYAIGKAGISENFLFMSSNRKSVLL